MITDITGQDGSYVAELLLEKGYTVHDIKRRASSFNTSRIDHLYQDPTRATRGWCCTTSLRVPCRNRPRCSCLTRPPVPWILPRNSR